MATKTDLAIMKDILAAPEIHRPDYEDFMTENGITEADVQALLAQIEQERAEELASLRYLIVRHHCSDSYLGFGAAFVETVDRFKIVSVPVNALDWQFMRFRSGMMTEVLEDFDTLDEARAACLLIKTGEYWGSRP